MQETKNLNIDNEKNFFYKTYEYKGKRKKFFRNCKTLKK